MAQNNVLCETKEVGFVAEKTKITQLKDRVGESALGILEHAKQTVVNVVDRNGDGKIDLQDTTIIADSIGTAARKTASVIKGELERKVQEAERRTLQPIFVEDLEKADFLMPKLLRITEMDKRRAESEICKGSIGYMSIQKELPVISIYRDHVKDYGLTFLPDAESDIYYVDPSDRNQYIALEEYFGYMKVARINELQKIAQDLGAKHFRVTYSEKKVSFTENKSAAKGKIENKGVKMSAAINNDHDIKENDISSVEIAAEMICPGHEPLQPTLYYLQREQSILSLIQLRMDKASPIMHQRFMLKLSNSSGIKEKEAIKIDAALKEMKFTCNTTMASEARNEARRYFEYEIDF